MREQEIKVYEFVVNDLKKATEQLPTSSVRGRINKISASAFLGKAYLLMASIEKHREQAGSGETFYTSALEALNTVINSNAYSLKTYFPDNFILDKQYSGGNELIFTIEFNAADKNNFNIFGVNSGFSIIPVHLTRYLQDRWLLPMEGLFQTTGGYRLLIWILLVIGSDDFGHLRMENLDLTM